MLLNTRMLAQGNLLFDSNRAMFGGGIMMDDRCLVGLFIIVAGIDFIFVILARTCSLCKHDFRG